MGSQLRVRNIIQVHMKSVVHFHLDSKNPECKLSSHFLNFHQFSLNKFRAGTHRVELFLVDKNSLMDKMDLVKSLL